MFFSLINDHNFQDSNSRDSNWDADKSSPSITKISGGQTTATPGETKTSLHSEDDTDDDRGPMVSQAKLSHVWF